LQSEAVINDLTESVTVTLATCFLCYKQTGCTT